MMEGIDLILRKASKILNAIGGTALVFMMLLTVADVIGRAGGHPIIGTYEVVALSLAVVIGFTMPKVALDRKHVYMEVVLEKLPPAGKAAMLASTRLICIILFALAGYNLLGVGNEFRLSGEVSSTIMIPFFPVAYGIGVCCFVLCLVFMVDIAKIWRGQYE